MTRTSYDIGETYLFQRPSAWRPYRDIVAFDETNMNWLMAAVLFVPAAIMLACAVGG